MSAMERLSQFDFKPPTGQQEMSTAYSRFVAQFYPLIAAGHDWFVGDRRRRLLTQAFASCAGDADRAWADCHSDGDPPPPPAAHRPLIVVEIGPGSGANLRFLPPGTIWIGIEPNRHMHRRLRQRAWVRGVRAELRDSTAESLDLPDATVDAVIGTFVLCCIRQPQRAVAEIRRVLRLRGRYHFLEHVAAPADTPRRRWQRRLRPAWCALADGCHLDRDTEALIRRAGFGRLACDRFDVALPPPLNLLAPHISGTAEK
jgi:SAM-dependent methyltransferase